MAVKRRTEGHPILPIDLFDWLLTCWGEEEAVEVLDKVQEGSLKVEDVRRAIERPDIDESNWQDFEEGWRPDNW